jgi:hypothetical protein
LAAGCDVGGATGASRREDGILRKGKHDFHVPALVPWYGTVDGCTGNAGIERERVIVFRSQAGVGDSIAEIDPQMGTAEIYDAISLMTALRADARVTGAGAPLNIKAAAPIMGGLWLALFNCGSAPGGRNSAVVFNRFQILDYLYALEPATMAADGSLGSLEDAAARVLAPKYAVVHLELPPLTVPAPDGGGGGGSGGVNYNAGITGAATMSLRPKGKRAARGEILLLAASHATDGGEVLGTRLTALSSEALLSLAMEAQSGGRVPSLNLEQVGALVTMPAGGPAGSSGSGSGGEAAPVTARIEGVAVHRATMGPSDGGEDVIDVLAVTEPNGGASQLLQVRMRVPSGNWQHCHDDVYERRPRSRPPPNFVISGTT